MAIFAAAVSPLACSVDERSVRALDEAESGGAGASASERPAETTPGAGGTPAMPPDPSEPSDPAAVDEGPLPESITLRADASALAFPSAEVGTPGAELRWTITRAGGSGEVPLVLENTNLEEFTVRGSCAALEPDGACELSIQFNPQAGGLRTGSVSATAEGGARVSVELTGNAQVRLTVVKRGSAMGTVRSSLSTVIDCGSSCSALYDRGARVDLLARTENGSNGFLSGWVGGDCSGPTQRCPVVMNDSRTVEAVFSPIVNNLVFVTDAAHPANLGSVAAYDAACNAAASAAGINDASGAAYFAGMSSTAQGLRDRLLAAPVQGWVRLDGLPFTTDVDELFDDDRVLYPVRYTERGDARSFSLLTGTDVGGGVGANCNDWTSTAADAILLGGGSNEGPYNWLISYAGGCDSPELHLLCFGRNGSAAPTEPNAAGKAIWVSTELFTPGASGDPDALCARSLPPGASGAQALLATTTRAAASIPDPAALYVRPDGVLVGTGEQLASGQLASGIWQLGDGSYLQFDPGFSIWNGAFERDRVGSVAGTCNDWQASTGIGVRGFGTSSGPSFWGFNTLDCSTAAYLYCIEP